MSSDTGHWIHHIRQHIQATAGRRCRPPTALPSAGRRSHTFCVSTSPSEELYQAFSTRFQASQQPQRVAIITHTMNKLEMSRYYRLPVLHSCGRSLAAGREVPSMHPSELTDTTVQHSHETRSQHQASQAITLIESSSQKQLTGLSATLLLPRTAGSSDLRGAVARLSLQDRRKCRV